MYMYVYIVFRVCLCDRGDCPVHANKREARPIALEWGRQGRTLPYISPLKVERGVISYYQCTTITAVVGRAPRNKLNPF